jgi:hypothetical protein
LTGKPRGQFGEEGGERGGVVINRKDEAEGEGVHGWFLNILPPSQGEARSGGGLGRG